MKLTVNSPKPVIQPPSTYTLELSEQELIDIMTLYPIIGGCSGYNKQYSGRITWDNLIGKCPENIKSIARRISFSLLDDTGMSAKKAKPIFYPEDSIKRPNHFQD